MSNKVNSRELFLLYLNISISSLGLGQVPQDKKIFPRRWLYDLMTFTSFGNLAPISLSSDTIASI
jgi:hypothetical protein